MSELERYLDGAGQGREVEDARGPVGGAMSERVDMETIKEAGKAFGLSTIQCTTHHSACHCREMLFAQTEGQLAACRAQLAQETARADRNSIAVKDLIDGNPEYKQAFENAVSGLNRDMEAGMLKLLEERDQLHTQLAAERVARERAEERQQATQTFYGHRWARLRQLLKGTQYHEQASAIMANGTAEWQEAPQQYVPKSDYDTLAAQLKEAEETLHDARQEVWEEGNYDEDEPLSHRIAAVCYGYQQANERLAARVRELTRAMAEAMATLWDTKKRPDDCCIEAHAILDVALSTTPAAAPKTGED